MNSSTSVSNRAPVIRVAADLLLLLVCLFVFDRALFYLSRKAQDFVQSGIALNRKFAIQNPAGRKILILGTSRTYEGIHPMHLRRALGMDVYKESYIAKGPAYNYYFYQHYRRAIGIPKMAIYGIDYFIFTLHSNERLLRIFPETAQAELPYKRGWSLLMANRGELGELVSDALTELDSALGARNLAITDLMPDKMDIYHGTQSDGTLDVNAPAHFKPVPYTPYPGEEGEFLDALLKSFQADKVKVVLVILPEFIGTYRTNFERGKLTADLDRLASRYNNIRILNYNSPDRFPLNKPRYFIDGGYGKMNSHLSMNGSRVFDSMLIPDLKKILNNDGR